MAREFRVKSVRALERGLAVLKTIRDRHSVTLAQLHEFTGLDRATILRSLKTLEEHGWIQCDQSSIRYQIGPTFISSTSVGDGNRALAKIAAPILSRLGNRVLKPSDIGVCRTDRMVILGSSRCLSPFLINRHPVGREPRILRSALGRAYLGFSSRIERERLVDRLKESNHPDDRPAHVRGLVERLVDATRKQGYGVREPGYWAAPDDFGDEISAIAVPVVIRDKVIACMNLMWVTGTCSTEEFVARYLPELRSAADDLRDRLTDGCRG